MLKERVTDLMNRYENGDEWLSAYDVQDELEEIMDDEPWEPRKSAIFALLIDRCDSGRPIKSF